MAKSLDQQLDAISPKTIWTSSKFKEGELRKVTRDYDGSTLLYARKYGQHSFKEGDIITMAEDDNLEDQSGFARCVTRFGILYVRRTFVIYFTKNINDCDTST